MLVIRLSRTGRKKQPYYRLVVAEKSAPIKGKFVEVIGHFNPRTKELEVNEERAKARLESGAQPSETAEMLLEKAGILKREAITEKNRRPERKPKKDEAAEEKAEAPAAEGDAPVDGDAAEGDAPAEEGPAEEAKSEEAPAEDAKADEAEKSEDTPAEETEK